MRDVRPPNLEAFLTDYLRDMLGDSVDLVSNRETPDMLGMLPAVIIRDDGGGQDELATFQSSVGVSVLAGDRDDPDLAIELARTVYAVLTNRAIVLAAGSPITGVDFAGCTTPVVVTEQTLTTRMYLVVSYSTIGQWSG